MTDNSVPANDASFEIALSTLAGLYALTKRGETVSAQEFRDTTQAILNLLEISSMLNGEWEAVFSNES